MADTKISALPAATTPLAGTEVLPIVQSGATDKVSVADLTAGRDIATKQITSTVSGLTTALDGWSLTNGSANALFKLSGATYGYRGIGSNYVWIGGDGSPMYIGTSTAQPVRMGTNAFQQLTLETSGDVTVNTNNLVIGTSGAGIDFSATSGSGTSELLADYEEGTWTPIDTSGAGLTFTVANGFYTKIGREVYAHYYITYPATADGSNNGIGGLPFTSANADAARGGSTLTYHEFNAVTGIYGPKNTAAIQLVNGVGNALTNATCSGKTIMGCIIYFT